MARCSLSSSRNIPSENTVVCPTRASRDHTIAPWTIAQAKDAHFILKHSKNVFPQKLIVRRRKRQTAAMRNKRLLYTDGASQHRRRGTNHHLGNKCSWFQSVVTIVKHVTCPLCNRLPSGCFCRRRLTVLSADSHKVIRA